MEKLLDMKMQKIITIDFTKLGISEEQQKEMEKALKKGDTIYIPLTS